MEGYSVTEAASVLGVPTERVWELLARGVLSGVPDGETGMRVFLQPRPAPHAVEEPRRSNGGGSSREPEAEASPFRELLSEFRNLTERYGQALLALGESRGEVASLRSRVDLLEARFDLRLPMSGPVTAQPPAAAGWTPSQAAPRQADVPPGSAVGASDHEEAEPSPPRRRRRGQHRATDDFAEALARAEDPSPAELPGGEEAAAAFAALRDEAAHRTTEHVDAALPRELPAAEPIAIIEPDDLAEAVVEPVPEPIAEAPAVEAEAVVEVVAEPIAESPAVEAEAVVEVVAQPIVESPAAAVDAETPDEEIPEVTPEPQPGPTFTREIAFDGLPLETDSQPGPESEPAAWFEPEAAAEPEPEPSSEADWVEAESEGVAEAHDEPLADPRPAVESGVEPVLEVDAESAADEAPAPMPEAEPEEAEDEVEAEVDVVEADRVAPQQVASEPDSASPADDEPEPAEAEPGPGWEDAARADQALEPVAESEGPVETEPEGPPDAEAGWDRDRYTARIEEPDWIPEERSPRPPATTPPGAEGTFADAQGPDSDTEGSDPEPASDEPPWIGDRDASTPTGEETMLWFGREPNRAAAAWPAEDDSAAEMEQASTGGHAARSRSDPEVPIGFRPAPAVPHVDPPDVRAEYRATLSARSQAPSPASRAYRRLRRIFPG